MVLFLSLKGLISSILDINNGLYLLYYNFIYIVLWSLLYSSFFTLPTKSHKLSFSF